MNTFGEGGPYDWASISDSDNSISERYLHDSGSRVATPSSCASTDINFISRSSSASGEIFPVGLDCENLYDWESHGILEWLDGSEGISNFPETGVDELPYFPRLDSSTHGATGSSSSAAVESTSFQSRDFHATGSSSSAAIESTSFQSRDFHATGSSSLVAGKRTSFQARDSHATGSSSTAAVKSTSFQSRDSHVKLNIKSFRMPEFSVEIPKTATVGSLKRTIMKEATSILGRELHVGVLHQGKRITNDNETLLQIGISNDSRLDVTLKPNSNICQPLRYPTMLDVVHGGVSDASPDSPRTNLSNFNGGDDDLIDSNTDKSAGNGPSASMEIIANPALGVGLEQKKHKSSKARQRRNPTQFTVDEVNTLVEAVEELGTGRWQDIKRRVFGHAYHRTYMDLKDKWRTLVKTANNPAKKRRGVILPEDLLERVLAIEARNTQLQARSLRKGGD